MKSLTLVPSPDCTCIIVVVVRRVRVVVLTNAMRVVEDEGGSWLRGGGQRAG